MLSKIFGSKARVKILKIFLLNPDKKYYIRELARSLKLQVNSVRRELENLENFGLLKTSFDKVDKSSEGKKYYQVDKNFLVFEELKALMMKSQMLYKDDFIEKIKKTGNIKLLILTGVFASRKEAMVDVLIVGRVNKKKLEEAIKNLEKELGQEVNFTVMETSEFKYRKDITDMFLYDVLENKNIVVIDEVGL